MTPKAKITPFQFFTILFLSRIFALVTYIVSLRTQLETTDRVIMTVFSEAKKWALVSDEKKDSCSEVLSVTQRRWRKSTVFSEMNAMFLLSAKVSFLVWILGV